MASPSRKKAREVEETRTDLTAFAGNVHIMDGSMGHLCAQRGVPKDSKLWSARGLVEEQYHPIIVQAHMDYIRAGATMITTNNYAVQPNYYRAVFEDWEAKIRSDTELAARLAVEARRKSNAETTVRILGALPPYETCRPDQSAKLIKEFGEEAFVRSYREIGEALLRGGADVLIAETMNSWDEARLVVHAVRNLGVPLIVSMGPLRSMDLQPQPQVAPEIACKILEAKADGAPIEAFGFNCAPPEEIAESLAALRSSGLQERLTAAGIRLVAYANCNDQSAYFGQGFDLEKLASAPIHRTRRDLAGSRYVKKWCHTYIRAGVSYCGGCCGTLPAQIQELSEDFAAASRQLSAGGC